MAETVLQLTGVGVVRDGATLLDSVDWTVREGERWVVLGPNGAGKTTLLQIAGAVLYPSSGQVELLGERFGATDLGELRTRVGLSSSALADRVPPQERAIDLVVTASYGVLGRWREAYDTGDLDRATAMLGRVGLRAFAERRFGTLSEGERKRVLLARALMTDPELLLLDEPAAGLDLGAREALLRLLTRLASDSSATAECAGQPSRRGGAGRHHPRAGVDRGTGRRFGAGGRGADRSGAGSRAFGLPLVVEHREGRFTARAGF